MQLVAYTKLTEACGTGALTRAGTRTLLSRTPLKSDKFRNNLSGSGLLLHHETDHSPSISLAEDSRELNFRLVTILVTILL